jgi:hypothetical protein
MKRRTPTTGPRTTYLSRVESSIGPVVYVHCGTCGQGAQLRKVLGERGEPACPVCGEELFMVGLAEGLRATLRVGGEEALEGWARRMRLWRG